MIHGGLSSCTFCLSAAGGLQAGSRLPYRPGFTKHKTTNARKEQTKSGDGQNGQNGKYLILGAPQAGKADHGNLFVSIPFRPVGEPPLFSCHCRPPLATSSAHIPAAALYFFLLLLLLLLFFSSVSRCMLTSPHTPLLTSPSRLAWLGRSSTAGWIIFLCFFLLFFFSSRDPSSIVLLFFVLPCSPVSYMACGALQGF